MFSLDESEFITEINNTREKHVHFEILLDKFQNDETKENRRNI